VERGQLAAVSGLVLLFLAVPPGSLPLLQPLLITGLFLVLGWRVIAQLLAARPLLGSRVPDRPSFFFAALPFVVYLALIPWASSQRQPDGDEPFYLLVAHSLAYDFDAELTNNYRDGDWRFFMERPIEPQQGDPHGPHGELYSRHNELLPLVLVPAYRLWGVHGALATMAALAALLAWQLLRLAGHYLPTRPGAAWGGYGLLAFTPPMLLYATQVWTEVPAALLAMLALDQILRLGDRVERDAAAGVEPRWNWKSWLGIGLPLVLLPVLKIRFMLLAAPLLFLAWWYARRPWRPLLLLGLALGLVGGAILVYNTTHFGNPLKIHTIEELALHQRTWADYSEGLPGLFFDTAFGLFSAAPLWLILLPGLWSLAGRRSALLRDLLIFALPYLIVVAPRNEWYGGWSPPFRYGLFVLPLLALVAASALDWRRSSRPRLVLTALALLTGLATLVWLAVPGWTYNFADGRTLLLDHLSRQIGADAARFFPSSVRPRLATWLWPPLVGLLVLAAWWWPGRGSSNTRRRATSLGLALVFTMAGLLPVLAARWPTRVIEFEDPWVHHPRGHLFPDRWTTDRTRYQGGWVLRPGESLTVPLIGSETELSLTLEARPIVHSTTPFHLTLRSEDQTLATWQPEAADRWQEVRWGPLAVPADRRLTFVVESSFPRPGQNPVDGLLLDRATLTWGP
jgi:hypothetical protein